MGECTAVKNGVFTSTNCVLNPTEKYLTSYIKFGLLKNRFQITILKKTGIAFVQLKTRQIRT